MFILYDSTRLVYDKMIQSIKSQQQLKGGGTAAPKTNHRFGREIADRTFVDHTMVQPMEGNHTLELIQNDRFPLYGIDLPKLCQYYSARF